MTRFDFEPNRPRQEGESGLKVNGRRDRRLVLNEIERENAEERIREAGPVAELVRKSELGLFDRMWMLFAHMEV